MLKPMLAPNDVIDLEYLRGIDFYPCFASEKMDGVRFLSFKDKTLSRNGKPFPNVRLNELFQDFRSSLRGTRYEDCVLEGEIWSETRHDSRSLSSSFVRSKKKDEGDLTFVIFDGMPLSEYSKDKPKRSYADRYSYLSMLPVPDDLLFTIVEQKIIYDEEELSVFMNSVLQQGGEGLIVRDPSKPYKHGRCTLGERNLFKFKPVLVGHGIITDFGPLRTMKKNRARTMDAFGQPERLHKKDDYEEQDTLGYLKVSYEGDSFKIGSGFTDAQRRNLWSDKENLRGKTVIFKYYKGYLRRPDCPIFLGVR
jgi:DNA ligase-1